VKTPRRVYSNYRWGTERIQFPNLVVLKNGESPADYPDSPVAFETRDFGWVLSISENGTRKILKQM
jgi:hypothetical protein